MWREKKEVPTASRGTLCNLNSPVDNKTTKRWKSQGRRQKYFQTRESNPALPRSIQDERRKCYRYTSLDVGFEKLISIYDPLCEPRVGELASYMPGSWALSSATGYGAVAVKWIVFISWCGARGERRDGGNRSIKVSRIFLEVESFRVL